MSFVNWRRFKTNKKIILFCKHFNVKVGVYYFCQFTILTQFLSFR